MTLRNKNKEDPVYSDITSSMERIKAQNERYENATPEYKVLHSVLNHLSNAFYGIKYKSRTKEEVLLDLAEAKGKISVLMLEELDKTKNKEVKE